MSRQCNSITGSWRPWPASPPSGAAFSGWRRLPDGLARRACLCLGAAVALQYALGVATLLLVVPAWLGTLHQANAVLVLTAALLALHALPPARDSHRARASEAPFGASDADADAGAGPRFRMSGGATRASPFDGGAAAAAVLAEIPFPIWVWNADLRLVLSNDAAWSFSGIDPALAPVGTPLRDLVRLLAYRGLYGPGDPEAQVEQQVRFDRSRASRRLLRRGDGTCHELYSGPVEGGGSFSVAVDVTRHQSAIAGASEQAQRLEAVLAQLRGGVAVFDPDHRLVLSNPAYEAMIGLPRGAIHPGMHISEVTQATARRGDFINKDRDQFVAERVAIDRSRPHAWLSERPNGQVRSLTSQPVPDGGFLVEVADVTAARRAEYEARRRAAVLDAILASVPHGIVVFGSDGRVALVNAAHQSIMAGAEVAPGEHREDIARRRAESGEYGPGATEELVRRNLFRPGGSEGAPRDADPARRHRDRYPLRADAGRRARAGHDRHHPP